MKIPDDVKNVATKIRYSGRYNISRGVFFIFFLLCGIFSGLYFTNIIRVNTINDQNKQRIKCKDDDHNDIPCQVLTSIYTKAYCSENKESCKDIPKSCKDKRCVSVNITTMLLCVLMIFYNLIFSREKITDNDNNKKGKFLNIFRIIIIIVAITNIIICSVYIEKSKKMKKEIIKDDSTIEAGSAEQMEILGIFISCLSIVLILYSRFVLKPMTHTEGVKRIKGELIIEERKKLKEKREEEERLKNKKIEKIMDDDNEFVKIKQNLKEKQEKQLKDIEKKYQEELKKREEQAKQTEVV